MKVYIMTQKLILALAVTGALFSPLAAHAEVQVGDVIGTSETAIIAALEAKGYAIEEIETEDDEIEVEVMLNGQEMEIEVALDTGAVTEVETEDDDNDDEKSDDDDKNEKG